MEAYGYTWRKIGKNLHKRKIYGIHKSNGKKSQIYDSISNAERTINGKRGGGIGRVYYVLVKNLERIIGIMPIKS